MSTTIAASASPGANPRAESLAIPGPAGRIEVLAELPESEPRAIGLVCHPHPLHGGSMHNKVVYSLARSFMRLGSVAVRFNFRGVGASEGEHDHGHGELDDALAVAADATRRWPGLPLHVGGFSFGAIIAMRAAGPLEARWLVTVAPPVERVPPSFEPPGCPWLVVQGDEDDVVPAATVVDWVASLQPRPVLNMIGGAGHFFHGKLSPLRDAVIGFREAHPDDSGG